MNFKSLVEARLKAIEEKKSKLMNEWAPYLNAVDVYRGKNNQELLTVFEKMNMATCLDNALIEGGLRQNSRLFETTYQDNISFLGIQLPVISALLPSLVLNKLAIVQALDRRQGAVFYLDVKYGTTKGSVAAGSTMMGARTGREDSAAGRKYATNNIYGEALAVATLAITGNLGYTPILVNTVTVYVLDAGGSVIETFTDDGAGSMVSDQSNGGTGTINYATGAIAITAKSGSVPDTSVIDYRYNMSVASDGVAEVDLNLTSETIEANDFKLRTRYEMGAAIDLEKAHGLSLENEMVKFVGGEIKFEIDHLGLDGIRAAANSVDAADSCGTWDGTVGSGQEWLWKKYSFVDRIEFGNNNIIKKTKRGMANFIIGGNNVIRVIKQLAPHFVPASDLKKLTPTGPYEVGTLDGKIVVHDPFYPENEFTLGFRGDNYFFAGYIYAPYIPLFTTPTLITSDLKAQKGFMSSAGFKLINAGFYCKGLVTNIGVGA